MSVSELCWADIERLTGVLARGLPRAAAGSSDTRVDFDRIIGIARGGWIPAALLASALEVRCLESIQVRLYDGTTKLDAPVVIGGRPARAGPSGDPARTLFVDEILDSGTTCRFLRRLYPEACFATLLGRRAVAVDARADGPIPHPVGESAEPIWVAEGIPNEDWILFPWSPPEDRVAAQ